MMTPEMPSTLISQYQENANNNMNAYYIVVSSYSPFREESPNQSIQVDKVVDPSRRAEIALLDEISNLENNWDDCGATTISKQCLENALNIINGLKSPVQSADIYPNPHGTISLDWETGQNYLSIEIGDHSYSTFLENDDNVEMDSGSLTKNLPDFLFAALQRIYFDANQIKSITSAN